jgi:3-oxoacyl-[acyl-carrier-protein] synthase-1
MRMAMRTLDRPVDYLNPHATSTPIGDAKEMEAVRDAFGDRLPLISSTKSLTGHSLGAAGVQEAIYSILMMNQGFVCESAHIDEIDPAFADLPIVRERTETKIDCALSNSFGFGGTNASLAFTKLAA